MQCGNWPCAVLSLHSKCKCKLLNCLQLRKRTCLGCALRQEKPLGEPLHCTSKESSAWRQLEKTIDLSKEH